MLVLIRSFGFTVGWKENDLYFLDKNSFLAIYLVLDCLKTMNSVSAVVYNERQCT